MMADYLTGAAAVALLFYCWTLIVHGLGNTLMRLALWLYQTGRSIQRDQDRYGRKLSGRWVRELEGEGELEPEEVDRVRTQL